MISGRAAERSLGFPKSQGSETFLREPAVILLEFSMSPMGEGESVGRYVARSLDIIDASGLDYRLHAMGTVLEGEWDECFDVVKKCYQVMSDGCDRISCTIKVDARKGASDRLTGKVKSVEAQLGKKLKSTESE